MEPPIVAGRRQGRIGQPAQAGVLEQEGRSPDELGVERMHRSSADRDPTSRYPEVGWVSFADWAHDRTLGTGPDRGAPATDGSRDD
jgi:hypothetical protein